ncbi:MAG: cytochrome c biogenesis protein ResB [Planctomycetota bacterium]|jgi:hypothetical protein
MKFLLAILAHRRVTIAILAFLTLACGMASFFDAKRALALFYHSWWFKGALWILAVHTGLCVIRELTRRKMPVGFLFLHLGVVVLLAGGYWGYKQGVEGYLRLPVDGSDRMFTREWNGRDEIIPTDGHPVTGEFKGIRSGKATLTSTQGDRVTLPLTKVRSVQIDPDRPGRDFEKDLLHLKRGKQLEGFLRSIEGEEVHFETDGMPGTYSVEDAVFLRMGSPSGYPLGFTLRLEDSRKEVHPETVKYVLYFQAPDGDLVEAPPEPGRVIDLGGGYRAKVLRYFPDAMVDKAQGLISVSDEPKNPAVEIEISGAEGTEKRVDFAMHSSFHGKGRDKLPVGFMFTQTKGMPKRFTSDVAVLEEGIHVRDARIEVNAPFTYGGFTFYQHNWQKTRYGVYSTFQVVRDPGLGLALAGFALLMLGCIHVFYVLPIQRIRRKAGVAPKGEWAAGEGDG